MRDFAKRLKTPVGETIRPWGTPFIKITQSYWPGLFHTYFPPSTAGRRQRPSNMA
ncbi:hypothetical protein Atep_17230 [Allochromatium tepidum]|uniref:Uncharacterized protein n=1 Tax=Allochromatium tepidum TaxID=553982 RepID=A0ABM7QN54_9GAMM|nr:hypothetical protein Atep_17230 [Allochromatium tepidum]